MKTREQLKQEALRKAVEALGLDPNSLFVPEETHEDIMVQAQAVIHYFTSDGEGFQEEICNNCKMPFAYNYRIKGVKQCSIQCMKAAMRSVGLEWRPDRTPAERWGPTVPAVVPPQALALHGQSTHSRTDQPLYSSPELDPPSPAVSSPDQP